MDKIKLKTKAVRVGIDTAKEFEQAARVLSAELERPVKVSEVIEELKGYLDDAKENIKKEAASSSKKRKG